MSKYNLMATREDWDYLYSKVEEIGSDVKPYKKSQNFDQAVYAFCVEAKYKYGITLKEALEKFEIYSHDQKIKCVIN